MPHQIAKLLNDSSAEVFLVVEDSKSDQIIIKHVLEKCGYKVLIAEHGKQGLELLNVCLKSRVNVVGIISDILMPHMDGMQFLLEVRSRRHTKAIPFLFMTGVDGDLMWDAEKYGADGYLTKPISVPKLIMTLKELFPNRDFTRQEKQAA